MRRPAVTAFLAVLAVGVVAVAVAGFTDGERLVYSPGVTPFAPSVGLEPGQRACVSPIVAPDDARFERVRLFASGREQPGPPLDLTLVEGRERLGGGRVPGGYAGGPSPPAVVADVGEVEPDSAFELCVRNAGGVPVDLWGTYAIASYPGVRVDGKEVGNDISVRFERAEARSLLATLPDSARHAALWKAGWVSPAVLLVGIPLLLVAAAALLLAALRRA